MGTARWIGHGYKSHNAHLTCCTLVVKCKHPVHLAPQAAAAASASTSAAPRTRWPPTLPPPRAREPPPLATLACLWRSMCRCESQWAGQKRVVGLCLRAENMHLRLVLRSCPDAVLICLTHHQAPWPLLQRARHIEVQIFGDGAGNVVAFPERECSIQVGCRHLPPYSGFASPTPWPVISCGSAQRQIHKQQCSEIISCYPHPVCSAAIRRSWKRRPRPSSPRSCARSCSRQLCAWASWPSTGERPP